MRTHYGPWLCFEILLTWYLVCGCIMTSYRSSLRFVPVIFGRVVALGLKFGQIFSCHHFFRYAWRYWLDFRIMMSYRSSLRFLPVQWFLTELWPLDFEIWPNMSPLYFTIIWDIDLIFGMRLYNHKLQINFEIRSGWMIFG
jgi:hypothetical protein